MSLVQIAALASLLTLTAAIIWMNVSNYRHRKTMTAEERKATDDDNRFDIYQW